MASMTAATAAAAAAVRDIPKTSPLSRDNLTAVAAARSIPVTRPHPLPTPPNSLSPALPPHGLKAQLQKASNLDPVDSDLDLHEGTEPDFVGSPSFESAGAITPTLLAKFHLPDILLNHGPLAIRFIMGYLTTSVPGFSGIPPPKARRLVVAALEGRGQGHGVEGGGVNGDVEFVKVGWGRWDAKQRGRPARDTESRQSSVAAGSPGSYPTSIPISKGAGRNADRSRLNARAASNGNSASFSHDDRDVTMLENEADKMSLDSLNGPASASCSEAPDEDMIMNDDPEDATDDEDWAAVGAAALRAASYSNPAEARRGANHLSSVYNPGGFSVGSGMLREPRLDNIDLDALAASSDPQERDAIQALLQLGSV
ncbi:putative Sin3 binding protein-domain-containing protein [Xylariaceae sp. FL0662B]|nr:putative Sin3 binding protein-domain-containing protein [Xylariaceae sp. FL0662B]